MEGPRGPIGPSGQAGITGVAGAQGSVGAFGSTGPTGLTGPAGIQGLRGVPGASPVPARIQIFSTTLSNDNSVKTASLVNICSTGSPALSVVGSTCTSTTIPSLSIDNTTGIFTIPAGMYHIEAACSFSDSTTSTSLAALNMYEGASIVIGGTNIRPVAAGGNGSGTSFLSGIYSCATSVTATFNCDVNRGQQTTIKTPMLSTDYNGTAPTVFVTFIKL